MPDHTNLGMQCQEFDGLLTDALDGVLTGPQLDRFQAHVRTCSACGPLFAEVEAGRNWLKDLTEVEPPASLVTNILVSTTGVDTQRLRVNVPASQPRIPWLEKAQA
jgi:predicted anti-sigma-YlaC factor YlaD